MKRFYIVPSDLPYRTWPARGVPYHYAFSPSGAHWIPLGDSGLVLLCCGDFGDYDAEQAWHAHPEVARLQHPLQEQGLTFAQLLDPGYGRKQFKQEHLAALGHLGIGPQHKLSDLDQAARKIHPLVSLGSQY